MLLRPPPRPPVHQTVVQRSAYLANADDLIYGDSEDPSRELAYIGKLYNTDCFVPYPAVEKVRQWYAGKVVKIAGLGVKASKKKPSKGVQKPTPLKKSKGKAGGGGVIGRDEAYALRNLMDHVQKDPTAAADLMKELEALYVLDQGSLVVERMDARWARSMADTILSKGAQQMRTGGGSRLPSPIGKVVTGGPMTKDQLLTALGVPDEKKAAYTNVTVENMDPFAYLDAYDAAKAANANIIQTQDRATGIWFFYASALQVGRSANSRIQVDGTVYMRDTDFLAIDPTSAKGQAITTAYGRLSPAIVDTGWRAGTTLTKVDRGDGQAAAMDKWNALGAAAYSNRFLGTAYDLNQNWEWLHIQGAQIGGATTGGNLVPGLYVTNSIMIPFESMIERWARAGPSTFFASFRATRGAGVFATQIELWIKANGHPILGDFPERRLASFDPLAGRVVDKMAGEIMKREIDRVLAV
jgi:hypothetical protein